jgi:hypothetical protein
VKLSGGAVDRSPRWRRGDEQMLQFTILKVFQFKMADGGGAEVLCQHRGCGKTYDPSNNSFGEPWSCVEEREGEKGRRKRDGTF